MCFQRAWGYWWLEMSPCVLVALDVFAWILAPLLPFFGGSIILWIQGLKAAGSGLLYPAVSSSQGDVNIAVGYRNI